MWRDQLRQLSLDYSALCLWNANVPSGMRLLLGDGYYRCARVQMAWLLGILYNTPGQGQEAEDPDLPAFICRGSRRPLKEYLNTLGYQVTRKTPLHRVKLWMMDSCRTTAMEQVNIASQSLMFMGDDPNKTCNEYITSRCLEDWLQEIRKGNVQNQLEELLMLLCAHVMTGKKTYEAIVSQTSWCTSDSTTRLHAERFIYHLIQQTPECMQAVMTELTDLTSSGRNIPRVWYQQYLERTLRVTRERDPYAFGNEVMEEARNLLGETMPDSKTDITTPVVRQYIKPWSPPWSATSQLFPLCCPGGHSTVGFHGSKLDPCTHDLLEQGTYLFQYPCAYVHCCYHR